MDLETNKYKNDILDICNKINEQIIDTYNAVKNSNFNIAYACLDNLLTNFHIGNYYDDEGRNRGRYEKGFKEFIMKDGILTINYRLAYGEEEIIEDAINSINFEGRSVSWGVKSIISINIHEAEKSPLKKYRNIQIENKLVEEIKLLDTKYDIKEFFEYCAANYFLQEDKIKIFIKELSDLPANILDAHKRYNEFLKKVKKKHNTFLNEINENMSKYNSVFDYIDLYKNNHNFLIKKLEEMSDNEKVSIFNELLKIPLKDKNPEADKLLSDRFPGFAERAFRENAGKD